MIHAALILTLIVPSVSDRSRGGGTAFDGVFEFDADLDGTYKLYGDKTDDSNTYIYRSGADEWTVVSGGVDALICDASYCTFVSGPKVGASIPFADAAGTLTLQNIDALDATTETTIESAIDTLGDISVGSIAQGDDKSVCQGADSDLCCEWDTDGTEGLLCTAADSDGLGNPGTVMSVPKGTDDVYLFGDLLLDGGKIYLDKDDTDTYIQYNGADNLRIWVGNNLLLNMTTSAVQFGSKPIDTQNLWIYSSNRSIQIGYGVTSTLSTPGVTRSSIFSKDTNGLSIEVMGNSAFHGNDTKGAATWITTKIESVTFAADPGDASKITTSSIIPAGAFVTGISGRVTTSNSGGCTSMDIGIAAKDTDSFGDGIAVSASTTFTHADGNAAADWSATGLGIIPSMTAQEITVTAVGGDGACDDMVVALTVHYLDTTAAASD